MQLPIAPEWFDALKQASQLNRLDIMITIVAVMAGNNDTLAIYNLIFNHWNPSVRLAQEHRNRKNICDAAFEDTACSTSSTINIRRDPLSLYTNTLAANRRGLAKLFRTEENRVCRVRLRR